MTFETYYTVKSIGSTYTNKTDLTLYESIKLISNLPKNQINDTTRIVKMCGSQEISIAFFCLWTNSVKPFFSCPSLERSAIKKC